MMENEIITSSYCVNDVHITLNKRGVSTYAKTSYPIRYGAYSEIKTKSFIYHFNLNGEIRLIQGRGEGWPNPVEWVKRTLGNDWVYYSSGGYHGVFDCMGEYYAPCLSYGGSSLLDAKPFKWPEVTMAIDGWSGIVASIVSSMKGKSDTTLWDFFNRVTNQGASFLSARSSHLHEIIGGRISVLPPDTRHVDYDVIPVTIADGCLYNCGFCSVKSGKQFSARTKENIFNQIQQLKEFLGLDLRNYNSVFLGQHDALNAPDELILLTASKAYDCLMLHQSHMTGANLFLFGSVGSFLSKNLSFFEEISLLPYRTYINIGLESADPATLKYLRKPISLEDIERTFERMMLINHRFDAIEITLNFVLGENLPENHTPSILSLIRDRLERPFPKGAVYISPLHEYEKKRYMKDALHMIKTQSRLPVYYYLIQRL